MEPAEEREEGGKSKGLQNVPLNEAGENMGCQERM